MHGSRIEGFHRLERAERLRTLGEAAGLDAGEVTALADPVALPHEWRVHRDALLGSIELPLAVGIVGGNLECNPRARFALRLLGVASARELAQIMAAVGLAQNFAAVRALVTDGIQRGHMALHARGLAVAAGAPDELVEHVVEQLIASGEIKLSKAREILAAVRDVA